MKTKLLVFASFLVLNQTWAQTEKKDDLETEQVNVVQSYNPTIADAVKINDNPVIGDSVQITPKLNYTFLNKKLNTSVTVDPIAPASMKGEPLTKLYNSHVRFGFGNYGTPYGDLFINNLRSKKYAWGTRLTHFSSTGKIQDYGNSSFSDNNGSVFGKYYFDNFTAGADIELGRNSLQYYGYENTTYKALELHQKIDDKFHKQKYNNFGTKVYFESAYKDSVFLNYRSTINYYNYKNDADYHNLFSYADPSDSTNIQNVYVRDTSRQTESAFSIHTRLDKYVNSELYGANLNLDFFSNNNNGGAANAGIIEVNPFVKGGDKNWHATIGINAFFETVVNEVRFYPNLDIKYNIVREVLSAYATVKGSTERNTLKKMSTINPFIASEFDIQNSRTPIHATVGFRGAISKNINFDAAGVYAKTNNMALFANDTVNYFQNRFVLIYDDVTYYGAKTSIGYAQSEKLYFQAKASYTIYETTKEKYAWHKPSLEGIFSARYNLSDKIIVKSEIVVLGPQQARTAVDTAANMSYGTRTLKMIIDANVGLEYRYNKKLAAFANFNNLTNARYYRWNNYPLYRFNFLAGVSYSF